MTYAIWLPTTGICQLECDTGRLLWQHRQPTTTWLYTKNRAKSSNVRDL